MKKKSPRKLQLSRETIANLAETNLVTVAGAATWGNWSCETSPCNGCPDWDTVINC